MKIIANPTGSDRRVEIITGSSSNFCPPEQNDPITRSNGQSVYQIERNSSGRWEVSINGFLKATYDSGMASGRIVQAGGEVTKYNAAVDNEMGESTFSDLKYKTVTNNTWRLWGAWDNRDQGYGYTIEELSGPSHFKTFGHNP